MKKWVHIVGVSALVFSLSACNSPQPEVQAAETAEEITQSEPPAMSWADRVKAKEDAAEIVSQRSLTEPDSDEANAAKRTTTSDAIDHSSLDGLLRSWVDNAVGNGDCAAWNEAFHPEVRVADCNSGEALLIEDMGLAGIKFNDVEETLDAWRINVTYQGTGGDADLSIAEPRNIEGKWYFVEPIPTSDLSARLEKDRTFFDEKIGNTSPYSEEGFAQGLRPTQSPLEPSATSEAGVENPESILDHSSEAGFIASWVEKALFTGDCNAWNQGLAPELDPVDCTGTSADSFKELANSRMTKYMSFDRASNDIVTIKFGMQGSTDPQELPLYDIEKVDGKWYFTQHPELDSFASTAADRRNFIDAK